MHIKVTQYHKKNESSTDTKLEIRKDGDLSIQNHSMKKLNEIQENSELKFNKLRNKINEQEEYLPKRLQL